MPITLQRRMLHIPILHIDTNLISSRQRLLAVNTLEKWYADEVILINMVGTARRSAGRRRHQTDAEGQSTDFHDDAALAYRQYAVQSYRVRAISARRER